MREMWAGNEAMLLARMERNETRPAARGPDPLPVNRAPRSRLDENAAFVPGRARSKPEAANPLILFGAPKADVEPGSWDLG